MPKYNWNYPTKIWIGENSIQDLALACKNLNLKKPLIVTDKSLVNLKIFKHTTEVLKKKIFLLKFFQT